MVFVMTSSRWHRF